MRGSSTSDLAALVDTEARLDRALEAARATAASVVAAARGRAAAATAAIEGEIERERARIADEIARATEAQRAAIADDARKRIARFDAVRGAVLSGIVDDLARRLVALVLPEGPR